MSRNLCLNNGGRGIHVFKSDDVGVFFNTAAYNLESPELTAVLPRDEFGDAFYIFGEITVADSSNVSVAYNNMFARAIEGNESVAAAELFFEFDGVTSLEPLVRQYIGEFSRFIRSNQRERWQSIRLAQVF